MLRGVHTIGDTAVTIVGLQAGLSLLAGDIIIQRVLTWTPERHQVLNTLRPSPDVVLSYLWTKKMSKYSQSVTAIQILHIYK